MMTGRQAGRPRTIRPCSTRRRSRRRPRRSSTTISTAGCDRRRSSTSPPSTATTALPTTDVDELAAWFRRGADRKTLELYLETFAHTFGVMQEPDAIARVAAECAEDLAADGVVYAEVRMAPELCTERGLTLDEAVAAILEGFRIGVDAGGRGRPPDRHEAARHRDAPGRPLGRGRRVRRPLARRRRGRLRRRRPGEGLSADPLPRRLRVRSAARTSTSRSTPASRSGCRRSGRRSSSRGAERLGHGVRIVDDITVRDDGSVELGRLAAFVRDRRVPLEMCPTSNVHTGAAAVDRGAPDRPAPPAPLPRHRSTPTTG